MRNTVPGRGVLLVPVSPSKSGKTQGRNPLPDEFTADFAPMFPGPSPMPPAATLAAHARFRTRGPRTASPDASRRPVQSWCPGSYRADHGVAPGPGGTPGAAAEVSAHHPEGEEGGPHLSEPGDCQAAPAARPRCVGARTRGPRSAPCTAQTRCMCTSGRREPRPLASSLSCIGRRRTAGCNLLRSIHIFRVSSQGEVARSSHWEDC